MSYSCYRGVLKWMYFGNEIKKKRKEKKANQPNWLLINIRTEGKKKGEKKALGADVTIIMLTTCVIKLHQ